MTVLISAVICTHNRTALLPDSVQSLFAQTLAPADYEVILVDNASHDATQRVIERLIAAKPEALTVSALHEPSLGLAHARNTGLAAARGAYVAFLDDDAVAEPGWLSALIEAFSSSTLIAGVGGPVLPLWPTTPPTWLDDFLQNYLSILNLGDAMRPIDPSREWLMGANIAFRRAPLVDIGGFARNLGRQGINLLSNEETDVVQKLTQRGHQVWYTPTASVKHHIHAKRMTRYWILNRAFWQGISNVAMARAGDSFEASRIKQHRIDMLLFRAIGKEWLKDYLRHDVLRGSTRMRWLARCAKDLGTEFAQSLF